MLKYLRSRSWEARGGVVVILLCTWDGVFWIWYEVDSCVDIDIYLGGGGVLKPYAAKMNWRFQRANGINRLDDGQHIPVSYHTLTALHCWLPPTTCTYYSVMVLEPSDLEVSNRNPRGFGARGCRSRDGGTCRKATAEGVSSETQRRYLSLAVSNGGRTCADSSAAIAGTGTP